MQTYWTQVFLLPKKVIKLVTSVCRMSLWTGSHENSRKALIAWDKVCMPRSAGGLTIIEFYLWNKAAICKLLWAASTKQDTLWIKWIQNFYIKDKALDSMVTPKQACVLGDTQDF